MKIRDNILSDNLDFLDAYNPSALSKLISARLRSRRLKKNLSQEALSAMSGVSLGTLKRFEATGMISLKHLLALAVVLQAGEEFSALFPAEPYESIDDLLREPDEKKRQRGRNKL